jgi:hypothetical protein
VTAQAFFPNKKFEESRKGPIDGLASDLFSLVKRFKAQQMIEARGIAFEEGLAMAKYYRYHGMEEWFKQTIAAMRKEQAGQPLRDTQYYQRQYLLEEEAASFESLNNSFEDDANILRVNENLDIAYLINKTEIMCLLRHQQKLSQHVTFDDSAPLTKAALCYPPEYPQVPVYDLNLLVYRLLDRPDDDVALGELEKKLEAHQNAIPFEKLRNLKAFYRNIFLQRYIRSGDSGLRRAIFQICKQHYEQGYFYEQGLIMVNSLRMLVQFGLKVQEYGWVQELLDKHPPTSICGTNFPLEAHNLFLGELLFLHPIVRPSRRIADLQAFQQPHLQPLRRPAVVENIL